MNFTLNNIISTKVFLVTLAIMIFIQYIMDDNYSKIVIKY